MSAMVTWAPCSANVAAMPEPSPDTPPVMRAVLFFNFEISIYLSKSILPAMMPKAMNSNEPLIFKIWNMPKSLLEDNSEA